jgi:L-fuconolactonase
MKIIDSHHHLWQYSKSEYPWMGEAAGALKHDFLIPELELIAKANEISGFVSVQARQTIEETQWLLELAERCELIRGVVGWFDLQDAELLGLQIKQFSSCRLLKGVRHVVQDEPDDEFILGTAFNRGVEALASTDWVYDILIFGKHLANTIKFVDLHPNQTFVLDHIAKPTVATGQFDQKWATEIRELAKRSNVACKFSGVATEVRDANWDVSTIRPYWEVMLEAFGSRRIMFGSDWPVCLLRTEYNRWKSSVGQLASSLSQDEQQAFWSANASRIYRL